MIYTADNWKDYELIDTADGKRLERWGAYILVRPDPQIIWRGTKQDRRWQKADASYIRSKKGGGGWTENSLPESWTVSYEPLGLRFMIKPMGFKHTGLFPEQAANWQWFYKVIRKAVDQGRTVRVLNLFAYTGGATIAAAKAGAQVCHVDASKGMVAQAKENAVLSGLADAPIRYIVDDCKKFVERELRRGHKYDAIIMDPPSYGRGPGGELWKLEEQIDGLILICRTLMSEDPLFFLLNSYTTGLSPSTMGYMLHLSLKASLGGIVEAGEVGLPVTCSGAVLPCGAAARWYKEGI